MGFRHRKCHEACTDASRRVKRSGWQPECTEVQPKLQEVCTDRKARWTYLRFLGAYTKTLEEVLPEKPFTAHAASSMSKAPKSGFGVDVFELSANLPQFLDQNTYRQYVVLRGEPQVQSR